MDKFKDPIPESLRKSMEQTHKLTEAMQPIIKQQEMLSKLVEPAMTYKNSFTNLADKLNNSEMITVINNANHASRVLTDSYCSALQHYDFGISAAMKSITSSAATMLRDSMSNMVANISASLVEAIRSPMIEWIQSLDFSPIYKALEQIRFFDPSVLERYKKLDETYLRAMYECKWFPYAGWIADISLFTEVNEILGSSRGFSKRCEKRIDKVILTYYTKAEIKQIKREWKETNLEPHMKKALGQTLEAYLRKEYALVIPFLATMWEGLIKSKIQGEKKKYKDEFKQLVDDNGFDAVFSDFYINMIIGTCYGTDDVIDGVPNRNGIAHSWYPKYPSQKAALNAILLTDFLIKLEPMNDNNMEEEKDG